MDIDAQSNDSGDMESLWSDSRCYECGTFGHSSCGGVGGSGFKFVWYSGSGVS
jgi:hypothetical protein